MDKNILKVVIADNQLEVPRYKVIPRDFTFEEFGNYVFVGIRRAGKSYLLYQRMQQLLAQGVPWDEILYINFEESGGFESAVRSSSGNVRKEAYPVFG